MSPYALLGLSVLFEVFGDTCMKLSEGFKRKLPIIGIVVGYAVSFYALSHVFARTISPVGTRITEPVRSRAAGATPRRDDLRWQRQNWSCPRQIDRTFLWR